MTDLTRVRSPQMIREKPLQPVYFHQGVLRNSVRNASLIGGEKLEPVLAFKPSETVDRDLTDFQRTVRCVANNLAVRGIRHTLQLLNVGRIAESDGVTAQKDEDFPSFDRDRWNVVSLTSLAEGTTPDDLDRVSRIVAHDFEGERDTFLGFIEREHRSDVWPQLGRAMLVGEVASVPVLA